MSGRRANIGRYLAALLMLSLTGQSACKTRHCTGGTVFCPNRRGQDYCTSHEGCRWTPACTESVDWCVYERTKSSCESIQCIWSDNRCGTQCDFITDQSACKDYCVWAECSGAAKQCSDYSEDDCPQDGNCYVEDVGI